MGEITFASHNSVRTEFLVWTAALSAGIVAAVPPRSVECRKAMSVAVLSKDEPLYPALLDELRLGNAIPFLGAGFAERERIFMSLLLSDERRD
jgi:hypothetical protein